MNYVRWLSRIAARTAIVALSMLCGCDKAVHAQPETSMRAALVPIVTRDTTVRAATRALEQGRPWEATKLLAPLLRDPARRSPAAVLRAAEAASAWEGWNEVLALLQSETWLRTEFRGHGFVLLTRAALAISPRQPKTDSIALRNASLAIPLSSNRAERGERETLLARAHERVQNMDSARVHYLRAAQQLSEAGDWLRLRAANVTRDEHTRQDDYKSVRSALARERVDWTEASAREATGDSTGAIALFEKIGEQVAAFRLRIATASHDSARNVVRNELVGFLARTPLPAGAREAIALIDADAVAGVPRSVSNARTPNVASPVTSNASNLTAADELTIARAAAAVGLADRAVSSYARAFKAGIGNDRDAYNYADMLLRLDRYREAAAQFARVPRTSSLVGRAAYQRARALLRTGDAATARALLTATRDRYRGDTTAASSSLYLLGDLASDASHDIEARRYFVELVRAYPTSTFAPQAMLRAALIALINREPEQAARELDTFNAQMPSHSEALGARYWSGRAWKQAGNDTAAAARWHDVISRNGASYYAMLSARALGEAVWTPVHDTSTSSTRRFVDIDSAHNRARLLEQLGLLDEMRLEDDRLMRDASNSVDRILATARGFADRGNTSRAISLARRALDQGAPPNAAVYRLLYPVAQEGVLLAESARSGLDPALVAALIRQESNFTPHATSPAGARGLMQLMPSVGGSIARGIGVTPWDPVLLYQGDINVQLGVRHLSAAVRKYAQTGQALAAYNAGDSRVARWRVKPGGDDPELFVERIPYVETRDYVRIILRNRELYRALYEWPGK
ncbi:MAG: transglycosylase SLT domain-containing protein [Gemmatimonadaceae bacterium]